MFAHPEVKDKLTEFFINILGCDVMPSAQATAASIGGVINASIIVSFLTSNPVRLLPPSMVQPRMRPSLTSAAPIPEWAPDTATVKKAPSRAIVLPDIARFFFGPLRSIAIQT